MQNDSHITGNHKAPAAPKEPVKGPVPMRHRLRLGMDVLKDPQGKGMPSHKNELNSPRSGW